MILSFKTARPPLLFMHIHKTGGQALTTFLDQFFDPDEICPHNVDHAILSYSAKDLSRYRFFRGHISMHALSQRVPHFLTVTVLRNPRDRLVSAYHYWRRMALSNEPNLPAVMRRIGTMTLAQFLSSPETHNCCHNVQARLLAGGHYGTTNDERILVYDAPYPMTHKIAHIGTMDHLDAAAKAICGIAGLPIPDSASRPLVGKVNVADRLAPSVNPQEEELIARRTQLDWKAYNLATLHQEATALADASNKH